MNNRSGRKFWPNQMEPNIAMRQQRSNFNPIGKQESFFLACSPNDMDLQASLLYTFIRLFNLKDFQSFQNSERAGVSSSEHGH
mmetsp:Transcript_21483/g.71181  ORF Transcript_21483/g.71181 Transcript_21483/m.71181 type:complete len:83 (+) Transcript_21483:648-896(+)